MGNRHGRAAIHPCCSQLSFLMESRSLRRKRFFEHARQLVYVDGKNVKRGAVSLPVSQSLHACDVAGRVESFSPQITLFALIQARMGLAAFERRPGTPFILPASLDLPTEADCRKLRPSGATAG